MVHARLAVAIRAIAKVGALGAGELVTGTSGLFHRLPMLSLDATATRRTWLG